MTTPLKSPKDIRLKKRPKRLGRTPVVKPEPSTVLSFERQQKGRFSDDVAEWLLENDYSE
jgi:hypothetical protein